MRVLSSATLLAFFAIFFKVVRCGDNIHNSPWVKKHIPRFSPSEDNAVNQRNNTHLEKRIDGATFTFYDAGLGACGKVNSPNDFIVAINAAQYEGGKHCFETITITVNGKTTQAQITDLCPGCGPGGLDFSRGLFDFFGSESTGKLTGSWIFGVPEPSPTPTSTWKPPPTSTSVVKPTSTYSPPPTSTISSTYSTTSTSSSVATPTPTPLIPPSEVGNIADLFLIFIQLGSITALGHAGNSPS